MARPRIPSTEVTDTATKLGISAATLKRAKEAAGFSSKATLATDGRLQWVWYKADTSEDQQSTTSDTNSAGNDEPQGGQLK